MGKVKFLKNGPVGANDRAGSDSQREAKLAVQQKIVRAFEREVMNVTISKLERRPATGFEVKNGRVLSMAESN